MTQEEIIILKTKVRARCHNCGEVATRRFTWMLENYRGNPQSSGYGKDDCSWCHDRQAFACDEQACSPKTPEGYCDEGVWRWGAGTAYQFMEWHEKEISMKELTERAADKATEMVAEIFSNQREELENVMRVLWWITLQNKGVYRVERATQEDYGPGLPGQALDIHRDDATGALVLTAVLAPGAQPMHPTTQ